MKIVIEEFIKTQDVYHDNLKSTEGQFDNVMTEIDHYAVETQESFQGKTADAVRETIQTRFGGIHKSYTHIQDLMIDAVSDIASTGVDVFGSHGIIDTEVVEEVKTIKQREVNVCIDLFEEVNHTLASIDDILSLGRIDTRDLEELSRSHKIYCDQVIEEVQDYDSYIENRMMPVHEAIYEMSHEFGIPVALTSGLGFTKLEKLQSPEDKLKQDFL
ncbi:MAG: T7SS effector LXG polymorphic toxin [Anaerorhabdus sp.]